MRVYTYFCMYVDGCIYVYIYIYISVCGSVYLALYTNLTLGDLAGMAGSPNFSMVDGRACS